MTEKVLSVDEIRAVAGAAITAQHVAAAAKKALEDAGGEDEALKTAYDEAEQKAKDAQAEADALSQTHVASTKTPEQIQKLKRKRAIINSELRKAGEPVDDEDDEGDDLDDADPDRPLTMRDLDRIKEREATDTAEKMADAIPDATAKSAVKDALKRLVPSGDPEKDFRDAVAIASREKNNKILEELGRRPVVVQHRSGSGAPARPADAEFTPTASEMNFMRPPFNLTKEDILKARG